MGWDVDTTISIARSSQRELNITLFEDFRALNCLLHAVLMLMCEAVPSHMAEC